MQSTKIRASRGDCLFQTFVIVLLGIVLLVVAYPVWFVIIASVSDPYAVQSGQVILWPKGWTLEGFELVLEHEWIWIGFRNSVIYTVGQTIINIVLTMAAGYGLSYKNLPGRSKIMGLMTFTMFFSGGLIPTYMVCRALKLVNNPLIMYVLGAVNVWYVILARNFFENSIPAQLREAAQLDGCTDFGFFVRIALPLSTAMLAVLTIYYAAAHWNSYTTSIIYLRKREHMTLQVFLRELLITDVFDESSGMTFDTDSARRTQMIASMKYCVIIVASVPMVILYPFMQKYFVKGVMVGAIKG